MSNRQKLLAGIVGGTMVLTGAAGGTGTISPATEEALRTSDLIYVATQRKDATRSKAKPIWFYYDAGRIFFTTSPDAWKAKRIARGSPLFINVGSEEGPALVGTAEAVTDPALIDRMGEAYADKYWIAWLGLFKPRSSRVSSGKTKAYSVTIREAAAGGESN
jgi:general stress protein 26